LLLFTDVLSHRHTLPSARQWGALLLLALPGWLAVPLISPEVHAIPGLQATPWGTAFLLSVSAPLWLALLSTLRLVKVEVPRTVVGAGIAGIGAVCLLLPVDSYVIVPRQVPALLLELALLLLTIYSWAYAREHLAPLTIVTAAAGSLLVQFASSAALFLLFERPQWRSFLWGQVAAPWLLEFSIYLICTYLWFWLLQHLSLPAFCMNPLALWTATLVLTFVLFGLFNWRVDLALVIAAAAITVPLRARTADEQPVVLGLHSR
jgi:drug/metabolite transporter (DMT)-like permease